MRILSVIPARGGSTRLVNKNIHLLKGKPLIRWITEAVVETNGFEDILISTDSNDIFNAVSDLPVERHVRPSEYATTKSTVLDAMIDVMVSTEKQYDAFCYFLPTCPFISSEDILKGISMLKDGSCDSVVSMTEITETIQLACLINDDNVLPFFDNLENGLTNSKYIKKYYKPSGGFYMSKWQHLASEKNFFKGRTKGVVIPLERSVDINTLEDIKHAEALFPNAT
jgi:CMP-N-acetylneuraminic acid synthetase